VGLNGVVTISQLRADLHAADFTVAALDALWGADAAAALARGHRVPALRALATERDALASPLITLARVFVLGVPVSAGQLAAALPTLGLAGARALGLVGNNPRRTAAPPAEDSVYGNVDLRPYSFSDRLGTENWWIASDPGELATGRALDEDHVLGIGGASLTLSGLMMHENVDRVLDLGTGCGIQAMHASRFANHVIATDISTRALEFARLNAELNDIRNIEFRLGSLFEPVAGERFDLLVSNPPFVITPRVEGVPAYEYRDGGRVGDGLVEEVLAGSADHLLPGGVAQMLGNWEYRDGRDGFARVGAWVDRSGLDAWVIEREVQDPALYAETWIRDGGTRSGDEFDRLSELWLEDFARRGVTRIGFGYITLRKPVAGTRTLRRLERLDGPVGSGLGSHIAAALAAHDWQASFDDETLGRTMLTVASDVTEERHYWPGDEHPAVMNLKQGGGFARSFPLDTALAAFVGACDGELSVAAICAALAQLLEVDEGALRAELLPNIRELVETGFLLP
jgi:SAM-dependent methyltransferase